MLVKWKILAEFIGPLAPTLCLEDAMGVTTSQNTFDKERVAAELTRRGWKKMLEKMEGTDLENSVKQLVKQMELRKLYVFPRDEEGCIIIPTFWVKGALKQYFNQLGHLARVNRHFRVATYFFALEDGVRKLLSTIPFYARLKKGGKEVKEVDRVVAVYITVNTHQRTNMWYEVVDPPSMFECTISMLVIDEETAEKVEEAIKIVFNGEEGIGLGGLRSSHFGRAKLVEFKRIQ